MKKLFLYIVPLVLIFGSNSFAQDITIKVGAGDLPAKPLTGVEVHIAIPPTIETATSTTVPVFVFAYKDHSSYTGDIYLKAEQGLLKNRDDVSSGQTITLNHGRGFLIWDLDGIQRNRAFLSVYMPEDRLNLIAEAEIAIRYLNKLTISAVPNSLKADGKTRVAVYVTALAQDDKPINNVPAILWGNMPSQMNSEFIAIDSSEYKDGSTIFYLPPTSFKGTAMFQAFIQGRATSTIPIEYKK